MAVGSAEAVAVLAVVVVVVEVDVEEVAVAETEAAGAGTLQPCAMTPFLLQHSSTPENSNKANPDCQSLAMPYRAMPL